MAESGERRGPSGEQIRISSSGQIMHPALEEFCRTIVELMILQVAPKLGVSTVELEDRLLGLEFIEEPELNGHVEPSNGNWDRFTIRIYRGLVICIWKLVNLWAARVPMMLKGTIVEKAVIDEDTAVLIFIKIMRDFWSGNPERMRPQETVPLGVAQDKLSWRLMRNVVLFVIAHEFGHIAINLSKGQLTEHLEATETARLAISLLSRPEPDITFWSEEFGADLIGYKLAMEPQRYAHDVLEIFSAIEMFFLSVDAFRAVGTDILGKTFPLSKTHPPHGFRLDALRSVFNSRSGIQKSERTQGHDFQLMLCRYFTVAQDRLGELQSVPANARLAVVDHLLDRMGVP